MNSLVSQCWVCCRSLLTRSGFSSASSRSYSLAIARDLPNSFTDALSLSQSEPPIVMDVAKRQHENYVRTLREILPVMCLEAMEEAPDCCFVEDIVIAVGKSQVVLTCPGHPNRQIEVDSIKDIMEKLGVEIIADMRQQPPPAVGAAAPICDGGDVLNTGRHVFCGISHRTNRSAVDILSDAFGKKVWMVPVQGGGALHLKSVVTHLDSETLLVYDSPLSGGAPILDLAKDLGYRCISVPDMLASNVVTCNGVILAQEKAGEETKRVLEQTALERNLEIRYVDTSELAKKDAALTCCSVLLDL